MTFSKITLAAVALGFSFGPALAESGETIARLLPSPVVDAMAAPARGFEPSSMMFRAPVTPAQQVVIDRNDIGHQTR